MQGGALVLVDLQNAFCSPRGSYARRGFALPATGTVLTAIEGLLATAHRQNLLVVFTRLAFDRDYADAGLLVKELAPQIAELGAYREQEWDSELHPFANRRDSDQVIVKKRYDPFIGTALPDLLQANEIEQLFVAGLLTNVCVESTARSAFDRDYRVAVIADATCTYSAELQDASLITQNGG